MFWGGGVACPADESCSAGPLSWFPGKQVRRKGGSSGKSLQRGNNRRKVWCLGTRSLLSDWSWVSSPASAYRVHFKLWVKSTNANEIQTFGS